MKVVDDFAGVEPFTVAAPARQSVPFVFNSPHSGRHYPRRFLDMVRLDRRAIRRSEDSFVDELFACAPVLGAPLLAANFPRAYLDVNREAFELDPRMFREPLPVHANTRSARVAGGLGTVPRIVGEGQPIYAGRIPLAEATERISRFYMPYHDRLRQLLMATHSRFGHAVLVDCHSMPANVRSSDNGERPDFIIGDRYGTAASPALTAYAISVLRDMGYAVAHNKPYAGGFITEHYGRPSRGLHALQLEINRGLYMDESTLERSAGFDDLRADVARLAARLVSMPGGWIDYGSLAAE